MQRRRPPSPTELEELVQVGDVDSTVIVPSSLQAKKQQKTDMAESAHPAKGGCWAVCLVKFGMFHTYGEAVKFLDLHTTFWKADGLRLDYCVSKYLGDPGQTWNREVIKRVVVLRGFNYRKAAFYK